MLTNLQSKASLRKAYGETIVELGKENPNIVVLDCDLSGSTQTGGFAKAYPERFFNIGIAEQDLISTAAGFSTCGKIPFASTFAIFASGRAWEQVRNSIAYAKFNVKIVATHGGITVGEDGATHQALEDICLMRAIPGMLVIVPSDSVETKAAIKFAADYQGPVYVRIPRANLPVIFDEDKYVFDNFKAKVIKEGSDVTLISNGDTLAETLKCAELLAKENINAEVLSVPVVKPLDEDAIITSAKKTKAVITIEDHSIIGGLGGAVCECLSEKYPVLVKRIGINDQFGQSGDADELMEFYGLTAEKLVPQVKTFLKK